MLKKKGSLLLSLVLIIFFYGVPVNAISVDNTSNSNIIEVTAPVTFEENVAVDENGGKFSVGFVRVDFKNNFLDPSLIPETFNVKIYADDGKAYIEFSPSTGEFDKDVTIKVSKYFGYVYDIKTGKNIKFEIKNQTFKVHHFSRYCFS